MQSVEYVSIRWAQSEQKGPFCSGRPEREKAMSAKPKTSKARTNVRGRRTRDALGDALVALIHEKTFEEITVQQVLDRAGVSRTTFYTHFRDKDDLFLSDVEDFFALMEGLLDKMHSPPTRVAPLAELVSHVGEMREFYRALVAAGKVHDLHELGIGSFARSIEKRLVKAGVKVEGNQLQAQAYGLAGSMMSLMDWWLRQTNPMSPVELDALFHRMVWAAVQPAFPSKSSARGVGS